MRRIKSLRPRPGVQYVAWDSTIIGFGVRVSPAGAKTYVLKYRLTSGRVRWATIERVDAITLDEARKHAQRMKGIVADDDDPLRRRDAARDAATVSTAADRFSKNTSKPGASPPRNACISS